MVLNPSFGKSIEVKFNSPRAKKSHISLALKRLPSLGRRLRPPTNNRQNSSVGKVPLFTVEQAYRHSNQYVPASQSTSDNAGFALLLAPGQPTCRDRAHACAGKFQSCASACMRADGVSHTHARTPNSVPTVGSPYNT